MRVGVHKNQPVAGGGGGAGVPRAGNLVDRLEHDAGPGGAVGGIVVADEEFKFPAEPGEGTGGGADLGPRRAEELLLVEGGDDDGNLHAANITGAAGFANVRWSLSRCDNPVAERSVRRRNVHASRIAKSLVPALRADNVAARHCPSRATARHFRRAFLAG